MLNGQNAAAIKAGVIKEIDVLRITAGLGCECLAMRLSELSRPIGSLIRN